MMASNNFRRKSIRKIDLRLAHLDATIKDQGRPELRVDSQHRQLSDVTAAENDLLIERIAALGFKPENLSALRYAPIAETAWASGRVTERELVVAVNPVFAPDMLHEPEAVTMFRSWLSRRPPEALWSVWEDYTTDLLNRSNSFEERKFGHDLYQLATRVAEASGGLLNQGEICAAEQRALNRIARVYRLVAVDV